MKIQTKSPAGEAILSGGAFAAPMVRTNTEKHRTDRGRGASYTGERRICLFPLRELSFIIILYLQTKNPARR